MIIIIINTLIQIMNYTVKYSERKEERKDH
jgi:hypothetical protein